MTDSVNRWAVGAIVMAALAVPLSSAVADGKVKVFILAGQSNMEGKAKNALFDYQATDEKTKGFFAHLRDGDGWVVRDDVFIKFLDRHGKLTLGYGSPGRTGVEYEFGYRMGEHFDEPVLLIKAAWGGHSLFRDFRSPSNPPPQERLDSDLAKAIKLAEKQKKDDPPPTMDQIREMYGKSYRNMMAQIADAKANSAELFPELVDKEFEFAGFLWFQGWNDKYSDAAPAYAANLQAFIKDVRKDLNTPELPFVIAVMGQGGPRELDPRKPIKVIQDAQLAMNDVPEFKGNVKAYRTDVLIDKAAQEAVRTYKEDPQTWERTGSDAGYHYLGSAIWFTRIGGAGADAMIELIRGPQGQENADGSDADDARSTRTGDPSAVRAADANTPLHLFILAGQSNMGGLDPDRTFTPAAARALGAENVLVVKHAAGGVPIRRWYKKWAVRKGENDKQIGDLYDALMVKVRRALDERRPTTVTFIWMQGEKDAREDRPGDYDTAMRGLINQLRGDLRREDMNFVIGRICDYGNDKAGERPSWNAIRSTHVKVAADDPRGAWVDTDDLNGPDDDLHYVKPDGYDELGRRFAATAIELIGKADRSEEQGLRHHYFVHNLGIAATGPAKSHGHPDICLSPRYVYAYNHRQPHSSLNWQTAAACAATLTDQPARTFPAVGQAEPCRPTPLDSHIDTGTKNPRGSLVSTRFDTWY